MFDKHSLDARGSRDFQRTDDPASTSTTPLIQDPCDSEFQRPVLVWWDEVHSAVQGDLHCLCRGDGYPQRAAIAPTSTGYWYCARTLWRPASMLSRTDACLNGSASTSAPTPACGGMREERGALARASENCTH